MTNELDLIELIEHFKTGTIQEQSCRVENLTLAPILLYGAGNIGRKLYMCLKQNQIKVVGFIDRNETLNQSDYEIPVYQPESNELELFKDKGYVILSALFSLYQCRKIKSDLQTLGFKNVYALQEVKLNSIDCDDFYKTLFIGSYQKENLIDKDSFKAIQALKLFQTEKEKKFYLEYIKAYLTKNFTGFDEPFDTSLQYLAHDIPQKKIYHNFIDCGGFDGDTLRNLIDHKVEIKKYAVFEPQNNLCVKIANYIQQGETEFDSVLVFPCGVHSKIDKLKFSTSKNSSSAGKIDSDGDDIIQCVAIDDVMQGFAPTFIKMDIEGSELEALKGAKQTIMKYHPQMAICVYHSLSDIWEIPLLIKSFYSGYKFYLRNYQVMGLETVVYAFSE